MIHSKKNLISNLQSLNKEEKEIIINIASSQSAISKVKKYDSFDEKAIQSYHFTKSQFDKDAMTIANFISKLSLDNDNSIMFDSIEQKNKNFISSACMNS